MAEALETNSVDWEEMRRAIFRPRALAVVGASDRPDSLGARRLRSILEFGYEGRLYAVNRSGVQSEGVPGVRSIEDIDDSELDLVMVAIPFGAGVRVVEVCRARNVPVVQVLSSPSQESDARAVELVTSGGRGRTRLIGPNCVGIHSVEGGISFAEVRRISGGIGVISQSGGLAIDAVRQLSAAEVYISKAASIGDSVDLDASDFLEMYARDDEIRVVGCYIEGLRDGRRFVSALREATRHKPVLVLRGGRSGGGRRAVASHTGSLTTEREVWSEAIRVGGGIEVLSLDELMGGLTALRSKGGRLKGPRGVLIGNGGGMGVLTADRMHERGLEMADLSNETVAALAEVGGEAGTNVGNPSDVPAGVLSRGSDALRNAARILLRGDEVDFGILHFNLGTFAGYPDPKLLVASAIGVVDDAQEAGKPVFLALRGPSDLATLELKMAFRREPAVKDVPIFGSTEDAVDAAAIDWRSRLAGEAMGLDTEEEACLEADVLDEVRDLIEDVSVRDARVIDQWTGFSVLGRIGVDVPACGLASSAKEAIEQAEMMGFPVALKIAGSDVDHKTEVGAVRTNLTSAVEIANAFDEMRRRARGAGIDSREFLVQRMVEGETVEVIVGAKLDPVFGPVVIVGAGGSVAEVVGDVVLGLAPVSLEAARSMIGRLRMSPVLRDFRGSEGIDVQALIGIVQRVSWLIASGLEIREIDLNPVIGVRGAPGAKAVDVRLYR